MGNFEVDIMFKIQYQYREQFWYWCQENNIVCEYMGASTGDPTNPFSRTAVDTWYIGNEQDRTLAILRWS
jgi:hypothetical protein